MDSSARPRPPRWRHAPRLKWLLFVGIVLLLVAGGNRLLRWSERSDVMVQGRPAASVWPPASPEAENVAVGLIAALVVGLVLIERVLARRGGRLHPLVGVLLAVLGLLAVEAGMRWACMRYPEWALRPQSLPRPPIVPTFPERIIAVLLPDSTGHEIPVHESMNSLGLREREIPLDKPPGEFRILCLGHSWVFGWGVHGEETWPRRLEACLKARYPGRAITVINGGQPGCSIRLASLVLKSAMRYNPDLVIVGGVHASPGVEDALDPVEDLAPQERLQDQARAILRQSVVYSMARNRLLARETSPGESQPEARAKGLLQLLGKMGVPAVVYFKASNGEAWQAPPWGETWPESERVWLNGGDLGALARGYMLPSNTHVHPSPAGYDRIAAYLCDLLTRSPWLAQPLP